MSENSVLLRCCHCGNTAEYPYPSDFNNAVAKYLDGRPYENERFILKNTVMRCPVCGCVSFDVSKPAATDDAIFLSAEYKEIIENKALKGYINNFIALAYIYEKQTAYNKAAKYYLCAAWALEDENKPNLSETLKEKSAYCYLLYINSQAFRLHADFDALLSVVDVLRQIKKYENAKKLADFALNRTDDSKIKENFVLEKSLCENYISVPHLKAGEERVKITDLTTLISALKECDLLDNAAKLSAYSEALDFLQTLNIEKISDGLELVSNGGNYPLKSISEKIAKEIENGTLINGSCNIETPNYKSSESSSEIEEKTEELSNAEDKSVDVKDYSFAKENDENEKDYSFAKENDENEEGFSFAKKSEENAFGDNAVNADNSECAKVSEDKEAGFFKPKLAVPKVFTRAEELYDAGLTEKLYADKMKSSVDAETFGYEEDSFPEYDSEYPLNRQEKMSIIKDIASESDRKVQLSDNENDLDLTNFEQSKEENDLLVEPTEIDDIDKSKSEEPVLSEEDSPFGNLDETEDAEVPEQNLVTEEKEEAQQKIAAEEKEVTKQNPITETKAETERSEPITKNQNAEYIDNETSYLKEDFTNKTAETLDEDISKPIDSFAKNDYSDMEFDDLDEVDDEADEAEAYDIRKEQSLDNENTELNENLEERDNDATQLKDLNLEETLDENVKEESTEITGLETAESANVSDRCENEQSEENADLPNDGKSVGEDDNRQSLTEEDTEGVLDREESKNMIYTLSALDGNISISEVQSLFEIGYMQAKSMLDEMIEDGRLFKKDGDNYGYVKRK